MNGEEVNALMSGEARADLDENKTVDELLLKLSCFGVAFHNFEALQVESSDIIKGDNFDFVPFPCGAFVDLVLEAFFVLGQDKSKKFLDVGSGIGSKVILASPFFDAYGIDYNEKYVEKAKQIGMNRVGLVNALEFDRYDNFDLIYYYRPIANMEKYGIFENMVYTQMKPGSLVAPMFTYFNWDEKPDIEKISQYLYRKKL